MAKCGCCCGYVIAKQVNLLGLAKVFVVSNRIDFFLVSDGVCALLSCIICWKVYDSSYFMWLLV